ncbi:unnamed protein product [Chrysoparadoxa australica]
MAEEGEAKAEKGEAKDHLCGVCGVQARRYCCPRCRIKTCSAVCCKAHKQRDGCTGKRDRTKAVALADYDDKQLRSDYMFLEEALQVVDTAQRQLPQQRASKRPRRMAGGTGGEGPAYWQGQDGEEDLKQAGKGHSPTLQRLVKFAREKRGIELVVMPQGMSRRLANTTCLKKRGAGMLWRVEWVFALAVGGSKTLACARVKEDQQLKDCLQQLLEPRSGNGPTRHALKAYCENLASTKFMLKKAACQANRQVWYELAPDATIADALKGKVIVEYPSIFVALPEESKAYPSLISDVSTPVL